MIKTEVNLETLIKTYAKTTSPNGIFISVLESDEKLAKILGMTRKELVDYVYGYLYLTDFDSMEEMKEFFTKIEEESHEDNQYAVLVVDGEIKKEYPDY